MSGGPRHGDSGNVYASEAATLQDYLPDEVFLKAADARRAAWTGGFTGLGVGTVLGGAVYYAGRWMNRSSRAILTLAPKVHPNHGALLVMGMGAFGSFVGSLANGGAYMDDFGDTVKATHPVHAARRNGTAGRTSYQLSYMDNAELASEAPTGKRIGSGGFVPMSVSTTESMSSR